MSHYPPPVHAALLTDLYQLTMLQAYWREEMRGEAVFQLFFRTLPPARNLMLACGLDDALSFLESLQFEAEARAHLAELGLFQPAFLDWLGTLRFRGDVWAVPEGTPVFPGEPLVEVIAPIAEAQVAETFLLNQIHFQTLAASKAARVVTAAAGRPVLDFGLRRTHGSDAGLKAARAAWVAGVAATSNVLAGRRYGIPVAGTLAHSYVEAHDDELEAFRAFSELYPETVLLVDTYDVESGVGRVVQLARELGDGFRVRGIRIDSGDLLALSRSARETLDAAGLTGVEIVVSGGLDEQGVAALVAAGAPVDRFGVGTRMGVAEDAPSFDMAYKLAAYAGRDRVKTSPGKSSLPGRKQVWRTERDGVAAGDVIGRHDEDRPGRPLLVPVMRGGRRLSPSATHLPTARARAARELAQLPEPVRGLGPADPPYPVTISEALASADREAQARAGQP